MLESLPWQHWVLIAEAVLSAFVATFLIEKGWFQRSWKTGIGFTVWNTVIAVFLVWGAGVTHHWCWQYTAYSLYLVLDEWSVIHGAMSERRSEMKPEQRKGMHILTIVWMMIVLTLIGTGAPA